MRCCFGEMTPPADGPVYLHTGARDFANINIQSEYRKNISGVKQSTRNLS